MAYYVAGHFPGDFLQSGVGSDRDLPVFHPDLPDDQPAGDIWQSRRSRQFNTLLLALSLRERLQLFSYGVRVRDGVGAVPADLGSHAVGIQNIRAVGLL